jgi:hypothetical protein
MSATDSYVQVAADATGKKVRNFQATDHAGNTVQQQAVTLTRWDGTFDEQYALELMAAMRAMLGQLDAIRRGLELLTREPLPADLVYNEEGV